MDNLLTLPVEDTAEITALKAVGGVQLGVALAKSGCSVEAAGLLRPLRKDWTASPEAEICKASLDVVAGWKKNWREIAQAVHAGRFDDALGLVGRRAPQLWDQPALLLHLARIAGEKGTLPVARHIFKRVLYLCDRGLPKTDMTAFRYVAGAGLVDVLVEEGEYAAALDAFGSLVPNPGNAMAHQLQGAGLLAMSGQDEAAMHAVADILVTAETKRKGWSAKMRNDFVHCAPELGRLRQRKDWPSLLSDPRQFLKNKGPR